MATFPQIEDSPFHQGVTVLDRTDLGLLSDLGIGVGWVAGAQVNPTSGGPTYAVEVDAGLVVIDGQPFTVPATASLTAGLVAAGSTDRRDLVVYSASSGLTFVEGTPCAVANWTVFSGSAPPVKPACPANAVVLAEVYIAASLSAITTNEIVDKRTASVDYSIPSQQKTAPYTLALGDQGTVIEVNASSTTYPSGLIVSVNNIATVPFAVGTIIEICQMGSAQAVVAPVGGSGVSIHAPNSSFTTRMQYSTLVLRMRANDDWVLGGDLT